MLTVHHLSKSYGTQTILRDISFSINAGERIGLVGPNGCGKTTLMRILACVESPDSGSIARTRPDLSIGYLSQGAEFESGQTIGAALGKNESAPEDSQAAIVRLASALSLQPNNTVLQASYDSAIRRLSAVGHRPAALLESLGLAGKSTTSTIEQLSGGQKTRLMLAQVLLQEPDLLLLDEPTNHLDIEMLEWLEVWLTSYDGGALIASHDRAFLDHTVSTILDLSPSSHRVLAYPGNFSSYLAQFLKEQEKQSAAYRDQQIEIRRMKQDIVRTKEQARHVEITTTPRQPGIRRIAKKVAAKAKSREKKLDRYLDSDERIERPKPSWQIKLEFASPGKLSRAVLSTEKLAVGYVGEAPLLTDLNLQVRAGERIVLTGSNGAGKTSLFRTIVGRLPPFAGSLRLGSSVRLGYVAQEQELIDPAASALESVRGSATFSETEARNFLHYFLFEGDAPLRPTRELSYGERARLQLALLVAQGCTFLLLDEPINHLDIPSRARFEQALSSFNGTVLAIAHDRYFIDRFATSVWRITDGKVTVW